VSGRIGGGSRTFTSAKDPRPHQRSQRLCSIFPATSARKAKTIRSSRTGATEQLDACCDYNRTRYDDANSELRCLGKSSRPVYPLPIHNRNRDDPLSSMSSALFTTLLTITLRLSTCVTSYRMIAWFTRPQRDKGKRGYPALLRLASAPRKDPRLIVCEPGSPAFLVPGYGKVPTLAWILDTFGWTSFRLGWALLFDYVFTWHRSYVPYSGQQGILESLLYLCCG